MWTSHAIYGDHPLGEHRNLVKKYRKGGEKELANYLMEPKPKDRKYIPSAYASLSTVKENVVQAICSQTKFSQEEIRSWFNEQGVLPSNNRAARLPEN